MCRFFGLRRFGCEFKPDLGHHLGIDLLQGGGELIWMISVVKQDGNFGNVDRFGSEVIQVLAQQFNQALVVGHTRFSTVGKKWQAQGVHCQMAFDAISAFVMTKPFGCHIGIASILYRL